MTSYRGPLLVLTPAEQARVHEALRGCSDTHARTVLAKLQAARGSSPLWREPCK